MNPRTESDEVESVRSLLSRLDQRRRATASERLSIEQEMWAVLDETKGPPRQRATDRSETVEVEAVTAGQNPHSRRNWVLAAAAALLLLAGGVPLAARALGTPSEPVATAVEVAQVRFSATFDDLSVSFVATEPAALTNSGSDFMQVRATEADNFYETASDSLSGSVVVAQPIELFDGQRPEEWFVDNGIQFEPTIVFHRGERVLAWNLVVPDNVAAERDCEPREPCVPFATLDAGKILSLEQGFELNRLLIIPVKDSNRPIVVFSLSHGNLQGPSQEAVNRLSSQTIATLSIGECRNSC